MLTRNRYGCLSAVLLLVLCLSLFLNFVLAFGRSTRSTVTGTAKEPPKFEEEIAVAAADGQTSTKIALLSVRGIISAAEPGSIGETMVEDLKLQLRQAIADDQVKGIVLAIDSPGGEVTASDVIYQAVAAARTKKPVVVYMGSLAASGGYYIACGGSHLMANPTTLTGSIGVILQAPHYKALLDKIGVEVVTFKSGKFKDMLSGSRDLTEEEKAYMQALIMQTYDQFVGLVAKERKQDEKALREGVADGRVLSGRDALENKLIDSLGSIEDAYAKARELGQAPGAAVIRYEASFKLGKLFKILGQADAPGRSQVEVKLGDGWLPKLEAGRLYYLPSFLAP